MFLPVFLKMNISLYIKSFLLALIISLIIVPVVRYFSIRSEHYDIPNDIKTHKGKVPLLGGIGVFISFLITMLVVRFFTSFPSGTLRELRYIIIGASLIILIGLIDDLKKPRGISAEIKFIIEVLLALFMITRGFNIRFITPEYIAVILSVLWIVGVTNAFNIIDIMDGLSSSQVLVASLGFFLISMPSEDIYVNLLSITLAGAVLGFLPYNLSSKYKIFLGDSGSLFCGFILSITALGTSYSKMNPLGVYAPLLILSIPIYDTFYVSYMRIKKGISPLKGTKDHFALRLEMLGYTRKRILFITFIFSIILSLLAYLVTNVSVFYGVLIYLVALFLFFIASAYISRVDVS
jgi:UDP-GlcNAc:undecaprenyl-phosphate GlcNAc-1-phosphate transferase